MKVKHFMYLSVIDNCSSCAAHSAHVRSDFLSREFEFRNF